MDPEELKKKTLDVGPIIDKSINNTSTEDSQSSVKSVSIQKRSVLTTDDKTGLDDTSSSDIEVAVDKEGTLLTADNKVYNPKSDEPEDKKDKKLQIGGEKRIEPGIKFDKEQKEAKKFDEPEKLEPTVTVEYSADPLPDHSQKNTKDTKDVMQQPTVYDTKEYYLPIKESHHGHGSKKQAIIFGIIFAVALIALLVFYFATANQ